MKYKEDSPNISLANQQIVNYNQKLLIHPSSCSKFALAFDNLYNKKILIIPDKVHYKKRTFSVP